MTTNGDKAIVNADQLQQAALESQASKRASADPLPGPLANAFCTGPLVLGGITIRKVVPTIFVALKTINSPLLSMIQDVVQGGKVDTEFTDEQAWELCWVFTHTAKEVRSKLEEGIEAFKETCLTEIGDSWDAGQVNIVVIGVMEQIKRHMATTIKLATEAQEDGKVSFFRE